MKVLFLMLLTLSIRAQLPAFMQDDKFKHEQAGMLIGGLAASSYYYFIPNKWTAFAVGGGTALLAGGVKDVLYDKILGKGVYSNEDIFATWFGGKRISLMFVIGANEHEKRHLRLDTTLYQFSVDKFRIY